MKKLSVLNIKGEKVKDITLNESVFGIKPNDAVLYDAITLARNSQRQGTHSTKTRSEVSGGGKKPWRQKGTGRARQGSTRAPQWRGGGIALGVSPRDYAFNINKKERTLALKTALTHKAQDKELVVLDAIKLPSLKTKEIKKIIENLKLTGKILFVTKDENEDLFMATRNLDYAYHIMSEDINCLDLVNADNLVIDEEAVKYLEEVLK